MGLPIAIAGFVVTSGSSLHYLRSIPTESFPENPWVHRLGLASGAVLSLVGVGLAPGLLTGVLAALTVGFAAFHLHVLSQHALPPAEPTVGPGDPLPPFSLLDEHGEAVTRDDLRGRRLLIKLFRGHW